MALFIEIVPNDKVEAWQNVSLTHWKVPGKEKYSWLIEWDIIWDG